MHRWFDWLAARQHPQCIFAMGESMGAAILLQAIKEERRFCAVVVESPFASFRQIAYVRVGQFVGTGTWLGKVALRPAVELAFLYGKITRGVNLTDASPEDYQCKSIRQKWSPLRTIFPGPTFSRIRLGSILFHRHRKCGTRSTRQCIRFLWAGCLAVDPQAEPEFWPAL